MAFPIQAVCIAARSPGQTQAELQCKRAVFQGKMPNSGVRNFPAGMCRRLVLCHENGLFECEEIFSMMLDVCLHRGASPLGWVYLPLSSSGILLSSHGMCSIPCSKRLLPCLLLGAWLR